MTVPERVARTYRAVAKDFSMPTDRVWPSSAWGRCARSEFLSRLKQAGTGTPEERAEWVRSLTGGIETT